MKILIVEDDHRIGSYLKKGLELKANVVDLAFDGELGLDLALTGQYDALILDRLLPKIDGIKICEKLRREHKHTPILMLTAKTQVEERVEGLEAGADDYLAKPFAFSELLARLNALSRRPLQIQPRSLTLGSLRLDPATFNVTRAGKKISLSKQEFALLEYFMRHPHQTIAKDQLVENVWPYDSDVLANTAQVYVGYLRRKIDRAFPSRPPLIQTVRGFGYFIKSDQKL